MFIDILCGFIFICILLSIVGMIAPWMEIAIRYTMSEEEVERNQKFSLYCVLIAISLSVPLAILINYHSNNTTSIMPSKYKTEQQQR